MPSEPAVAIAGAPIARIENAPLRIRVADMLRRAIISGQMLPGTTLVEATLAEQMNVSRAPVREAIQILENDGLVETVPYKGKRVKPLTPREIEEIYSLRSAFEALAVRRVLERGVSVDPLWAHCREMEDAAKADDYARLTAADQAFHRTLIQLSDHALLLASWSNLYLRIHQIMAVRNIVGADLASIAANHPPIVEALEAQDVDAAVALVSEHTRALAEVDPDSIAQAAS